MLQGVKSRALRTLTSVPTEQPTVLVVEDDRLTREFLADNLIAEGFRVLAAGGVAAAVRFLQSEPPDLIVLDLGLPDGDGIALLERVRAGERDPAAGAADPDVPLIVLSGRAGEGDRLRGFRCGADDYMVKPYSAAELSARIRALLRRRRGGTAARRLRVGPLEIDTLTRQVRLDGEPVALSRKEFGLLAVLAADPLRVYTRDELLRTVWGYPAGCPTRTLDAYACRLRRKLGRGGGRFVINVWGVGFKLIEGPVW